MLLEQPTGADVSTLSFYKFASASEPATYKFDHYDQTKSFIFDAQSTAVMGAYRGVDTQIPFQGIGGSTNSGFHLGLHRLQRRWNDAHGHIDPRTGHQLDGALGAGLPLATFLAYLQPPPSSTTWGAGDGPTQATASPSPLSTGNSVIVAFNPADGTGNANAVIANGDPEWTGGQTLTYTQNPTFNTQLTIPATSGWKDNDTLIMTCTHSTDSARFGSYRPRSRLDRGGPIRSRTGSGRCLGLHPPSGTRA